jgi:hypothetical protein
MLSRPLQVAADDLQVWLLERRNKYGDLGHKLGKL